MSLCCKDIHIAVQGKPIVAGVDLHIQPGEVHVLMGPNGSGKSTLVNALMGHPRYTITSGKIVLDGEDITISKVFDKAKKGLFLSLQYPPEVAGVTVTNFLRTAASALTGKKQNPVEFHQQLLQTFKTLDMDPDFASRYLNVGFSGGEKKRLEILQLLILKPRYALLDETDSGLDVDALKIVADGIKHFATKDAGVLLITHYQRILNYISPTTVHVMRDGKMIETGGPELAHRIEEGGYQFEQEGHG